MSQVRKVLDSEQSTPTETDAIADKTWNAFGAELIEALNGTNRKKLEAIINDITANYPLELLADRLLGPLQEQLQRNQRLGTAVQLAFLQTVASETVLFRQHPLRQEAPEPAVLLIKLNPAENDLMPHVLSYGLLQNHVGVEYMGIWRPLPGSRRLSLYNLPPSFFTPMLPQTSISYRKVYANGNRPWGRLCGSAGR